MIGAVSDGLVEEVAALLKAHPTLNLGHRNKWGTTALHEASLSGQAEIVKLLLAHPTINVDLQRNVSVGYVGGTPLDFGCSRGKVSVVQLLLKDPRVDASLADGYGRTPLWKASCQGLIEIVEWLIASGKDLGDLNKKVEQERDGKPREFTVLEIAMERIDNGKLVVSLLKKFMANSTQTRHEVRVKLGERGFGC